MKNSFLILILTFTLMICGASSVQATESEVTVDDEVVSAVESDVESNFTRTEYYIEGEDKSNYLVDGGNENAVNMLATEQSTAGGTVTENTGVDGQEYDMTIPTDEDFATKDPLELRQFITFETKSGKVFHIIIDHGKDSDNVMMLTEVSEQDLLNLIEDQADVEIGVVQDNNASVEAGETVVIKDENNVSDQEVEATTDAASAPEEDSKNLSTIIIIGIAALSGIAGWYFKIYKPKRHAAFEDEVDEADYIDDELINEDEDYV